MRDGLLLLGAAKETHHLPNLLPVLGGQVQGFDGRRQLVFDLTLVLVDVPLVPLRIDETSQSQDSLYIFLRLDGRSASR